MNLFIIYYYYYLLLFIYNNNYYCHHYYHHRYCLHHQVYHMSKIRQCEAVTMPVAETPKHTDDYKIIINDTIERPSAIKAEHVIIKRLDYKNLEIISTVMAQTVALDYYAESVDKMLEKFMTMNIKIEETRKLMQLVGS